MGDALRRGTAADRTIEVVPSGAALGAEVRNVDLSLVDDAVFSAIEQAWEQHLVLLFRNQTLDDRGQIAFSRRFGPLDPAPVNVRGIPWIPELPEMVVISNVTENGAPTGALGNGEAIWHTDMSYATKPPAASVLRSLEIPTDGTGDTCFANMYTAYETLPAELRKVCEGRVLIHDSSRTSADQQRKGFAVVADPREAPGARHPIFRTHPRTRRLALYLGRRRNAYVVGLPLDESEAVLDALWQHATQERFVWRHRWAVNDLLIWDNRCTLHRRDAFDGTHRRIMHRTQIQGDQPY